MIYRPLTGILNFANFGLRALGAPKVTDVMIPSMTTAVVRGKGAKKLQTRQDEFRAAQFKLGQSCQSLSETNGIFRYGKKAIESKPVQWMGKKVSWAHNIWPSRAIRWPFKTAINLSYTNPIKFHTTAALLTAGAGFLVLSAIKEAGDYFWLSQPTCELIEEAQPPYMRETLVEAQPLQKQQNDYSYEFSDVDNNGSYDILAIREGPSSLGHLRPVVSLSLREGVLDEGVEQSLSATIRVLYPSYSDKALDDLVVTSSIFEQALLFIN
ncbi:MAG: hypothetical protein ABII18_01215 [bacterium]|nr:hypothetical protein [bacterium]MBU1918349.1 hypothetical protein [bacterium]